jgi:hypothetical protein
VGRRMQSLEDQGMGQGHNSKQVARNVEWMRTRVLWDGRKECQSRHGKLWCE